VEVRQAGTARRIFDFRRARARARGVAESKVSSVSKQVNKLVERVKVAVELSQQADVRVLESETSKKLRYGHCHH
jgi:hypothetical protein